jgi:Domain of unknown function (DUF4276)
MMEELRYTLLADGSSDQALLPILTWLLKFHLPDCAIQQQWADLQRLPKALKDTFPKRIEQSLDLYPCELLVVHRDAEKEPHQKRVAEIHNAIGGVNQSFLAPFICVIPVRMTEVWLLFDEVAIRKAASNPSGRKSLQFPDIKRLEDEPDPKELLYKLLREASDLSQRRLKQFSASSRVYRVAELIDDFSPLRVLSAFKALEGEIKQVIQGQNWS